VDQHTKKNCGKVKTALETAGKTYSPIYKRACTILAAEKDPGLGF